MQLRKDPVTQSWVIQEEEGDDTRLEFALCPLCPGQEALCHQDVYVYPYGQPQWQVRVIPHLRPSYRIEGDAQRRGDGMYDKMRNLGAHEIVIETPNHQLIPSRQSDANVAQVLRAYVSRIADLKKDLRFRHVTAFRNQGVSAGQDLDHPHSEIAATPFIPRRVGYKLRASLKYFELKERCLFCDIVKQELMQQVRTVEWDDQFVAFCPFASRTAYETWILPINHHCAFEEDVTSWDRQLRLALFLKSILRRLETVAPAYHLVFHSAPNVRAKFERTGIWRTLADDYHWHIEILPISGQQSKSYSAKGVYYSSLPPEVAAQRLRSAEIGDAPNP
jgi:UDPglucose--hexose-1-phosphate uridylyltransferase